MLTLLRTGVRRADGSELGVAALFGGIAVLVLVDTARMTVPLGQCAPVRPKAVPTVVGILLLVTFQPQPDRLKPSLGGREVRFRRFRLLSMQGGMAECAGSPPGGRTPRARTGSVREHRLSVSSQRS